MPLTVITEDGKPVTTGDPVFNYYDGFWGYVGKVEDQFSGLRAFPADYPEYADPNPNQDYWFDVTDPLTGRKAYLNGQRVATRDPRGSKLQRFAYPDEAFDVFRFMARAIAKGHTVRAPGVSRNYPIRLA